MPPSKRIDDHIAHEETPATSPATPGGVPDDMDVGKTATPEPADEWVNAGGAYGGLRQRIDRDGKAEKR